MWLNSPQRAAIAIDRLMGMRLVQGSTVVSWVFKSAGMKSVDDELEKGLAMEVRRLRPVWTTAEGRASVPASRPIRREHSRTFAIRGCSWPSRRPKTLNRSTWRGRSTRT